MPFCALIFAFLTAVFIILFCTVMGNAEATPEPQSQSYTTLYFKDIRSFVSFDLDSTPQSEPNNVKMAESKCSTWEVGMHCGGCEKVVRAVLTKTPGVEKVDINLETQKVVVTGSATEEALVAALTKSGKPYKKVDSA